MLKRLQGQKLICFLTAALLLSSSAMAQDKATGPLPPGKPAGVKQASSVDDEVPWLLVTAVVSLAGGFLLLHHNTPTGAAAPVSTS